MRPAVVGALVRSRSHKEAPNNVQTPSRSLPRNELQPTPTRPPPRKALQLCDQNAIIRVLPLPLPQTHKTVCVSAPQSASINITAQPPLLPLSTAMAPPYEKNRRPHPLSSNSNTNSNSNSNTNTTSNTNTNSAASKPALKAPLTPRVANSPSTPSSRTTYTSEADSTPLSAISRDDFSTPVSAFLDHNNITPRSGARKLRAESPLNTPANNYITPASPPPELAPALHESTLTSHGGLGGSAIDTDMRRAPRLAPSPAADSASSRTQPSSESKFFLASDAAPARPPPPTKSPTFLYANGETIPSGKKTFSSSGSAVGSSVGAERAQPKFFHANGTPDLQLSPSPHFSAPRKAASAISNNSRTTSPRLPTQNPGTFPRGPSPNKPRLNNHSSLASLNCPPGTPSPPLQRPQLSRQGGSAVGSRRTSGELRVSQRSGIGGSTEARPQQARRISGTLSKPGTPEPGSATSPRASTHIPRSTPEESLKYEEVLSPYLEPQSPIKAGGSLEQMNEMAADARRERKVLDLEITNSSLTAINKTLEREMRKQTAELRRFRRLSRSGRLSILNDRPSSGKLSTIDSDDSGESDSEADSAEEEELSEDEESIDDGSLSEAAIAASDLRHRKRDERRLQLDLSKHQQLLVDSQSMNQSLKRCLAWTEELIGEGRKALEYRVMIGDVTLGGRILDEIEAEVDREEGMEGLSELGKEVLREARKAAASRGTVTWGNTTGKDDRDSGIELGAHVPQQKESGGGILGLFR